MNSVFSLFTALFRKRDVTSLEKTAMAPEVAKAYNKTRIGKNHRTFCNAPSVNMYFTQDGTVKACCHNSEFSIGTYPGQSLKEIWNGDRAREFRNNMRRYDLSTGCRICEMDIESGAFEEVPARHFDVLPSHPEYPVMMEFLLTNTCNLDCLMCKGEFSSLIRKNREKLPPLSSPYDNEFLRQLEEFIPHLRETRFSGSGEAFSIDMNYMIWEMIITHNPKCLIVVQTNGTILTARVKDILSRGNFQIGVSLDSLQKETFETIRINANFDKVMENIRYFNDYCKRVNSRFSISTCVMRQNWRELPEFILFANSIDAIATFHKVWFPREYALHNLPAKGLTDIYNYLSSFDFDTSSPVKKKNNEHFHYFTGVVKQWTKETMKREEEINYLTTQSADSLWFYAENKLAKGIAKGNETREEKNEILNICMNKLKAVLLLYDDNEKDEALRKMCLSPADEMVKALRYQSAEVLFEQAKRFLNPEAVPQE
jgi:radical SAM protein with 4Fe4S-binding SPASM domain